MTSTAWKDQQLLFSFLRKQKTVAVGCHNGLDIKTETGKEIETGKEAE